MALDAQEKIDIAKQKKGAADDAFKAGEIKDALRSYHEALLYLQGMDRNAMQAVAPPGEGNGGTEQKKTEADELIEKVYANICACHIKNANWKRALESADKALAKNENNHKAIFRKGKAQAELGYVEKAEKTLGDLLKKNPADAPAINAELVRIRAADAERQKKHDQKMRGFLSRESKEKTAEQPQTTDAADAASP